LYYSIEHLDDATDEEMEEIGSTVDQEIAKEEEVQYFHCSFVEGLKHAKNANFYNKRIIGRESEFYNNHFEEVREKFCCNHVL
jgi:hypothetical protein